MDVPDDPPNGYIRARHCAAKPFTELRAASISKLEEILAVHERQDVVHEGGMSVRKVARRQGLRCRRPASYAGQGARGRSAGHLQ